MTSGDLVNATKCTLIVLLIMLEDCLNCPFRKQGHHFISFLINLISLADKKLILCSNKFEELVENMKHFNSLVANYPKDL